MIYIYINKQGLTCNMQE